MKSPTQIWEESLTQMKSKLPLEIKKVTTFSTTLKRETHWPTTSIWTSLIQTPESKELPPLKLTNKAEREDKKELLKREDWVKKKEKSSRKENPTVKNGSRPSETTFQNWPKRVCKKTKLLKN